MSIFTSTSCPASTTVRRTSTRRSSWPALEVADGIDTATATPHVASVDVCEIPQRVAEVNAALRAARIPLTVEGGGELAARGAARLSSSELDLIAHGPPGARWILLEAPLDGAIQTLHRAADILRGEGYGIVLAHPERCHPLFDDDMAGLRRELRLGSLAQVSSSSVLGLHGIRARRNAVRMLANGCAGLLASRRARPAPPAVADAGDESRDRLRARPGAGARALRRAAARTAARGPAAAPDPAVATTGEFASCAREAARADDHVAGSEPSLLRRLPPALPSPIS